MSLTYLYDLLDNLYNRLLYEQRNSRLYKDILDEYKKYAKMYNKIMNFQAYQVNIENELRDHK